MRTILFYIINWLGIVRLLRFFHRNKIIIFKLHGVMDTEEATAWVPLRAQVSPTRLESVVRLLSQYYKFISLDDAVDMLTGRKPLIPYCVVFTFDDGYRNNITHALPVLKKYNIQPTIFLSTGHVENRKPFWFERLDYVIQHADMDKRDVQVGKKKIRFNAPCRETLKSSYKHYIREVKAMERNDMEMLAEIDALTSDLEAECGRSLIDIFEHDKWAAVLSWPEITKHSAEGVSFGSHTVDHVRLRLVGDETIQDQLFQSKEMIELHLKKTCDHFAYPNGSFDNRVVRLVRMCGYKSAVTTINGFNKVKDDPMLLRRVSLPVKASPAQSLAAVCGVSIMVEQLKTSLRKRLLKV